MKIILGKECTIRQLDDSKKEKLGQALEGKRGTIAIDVTALEKIDTAFLQTLLAIIATCKNNGRKYEIRGKSEPLQLILDCYGIEL